MFIGELIKPNHVLNELQKLSLEDLVSKVSEVEELHGTKFLVTSGFRTKEEQLRINPFVKNSAHMSGMAVDISDPDGDIWNWFMDNLDYFVRLGLYLESRNYTPRWIHIQTRVPKSGNRIFCP